MVRDRVSSLGGKKPPVWHEAYDKDSFREMVERFLETVTKVKLEQDTRNNQPKRNWTRHGRLLEFDRRFLLGWMTTMRILIPRNLLLLSIRYEKQCKSERSQLEIATALIDVMKEFLTTLGSTLKIAMTGASNNEDQMKILERNHGILREKTGSISELLPDLRSKLQYSQQYLR